jgi:hypothetical protein
MRRDLHQTMNPSITAVVLVWPSITAAAGSDPAKRVELVNPLSGERPCRNRRQHSANNVLRERASAR